MPEEANKYSSSKESGLLSHDYMFSVVSNLSGHGKVFAIESDIGQEIRAGKLCYENVP